MVLTNCFQKSAYHQKDWLSEVQVQDGYKKVDLPHDYSISLPRSPSAPGGGSATVIFRVDLRKYA